MKVLDLFSGIGGFSLGLERAGMKTVAFCEIEPYCRAVLKKHWPKVPCYEDVRTLKGTDVGPVDVICGGFPCQDISAAGDQIGLDGDRSGLWAEIARLVGELRPNYVIVENVSALLSGNGGQWFGRVLSDLAALGYDAEWECISASGVGAEHGRERVWIVAYPNEVGRKIRDFSITGRPLPRDWLDRASGAWRSTVPEILRMVDVVPVELDAGRIAALGNAVVPQIPEIIGRAIMAAQKETAANLSQEI